MASRTAENILWQEYEVTKSDRHALNGHRSCVIWMTGLSGSGKSTLANAVSKRLHDMGKRSFVLDGDNIRHGLNKGLGFSEEDRKENIRRISEVAKLFVEAGIITIAAFISPFREDRDRARELFEPDEFIETYVKCPLEVCEERDPKGLYAKVRSGQITSFTGISSPYEEPLSPEITIESAEWTVKESVDAVIDCLLDRGII